MVYVAEQYRSPVLSWLSTQIILLSEQFQLRAAQTRTRSGIFFSFDSKTALTHNNNTVALRSSSVIILYKNSDQCYYPMLDEQT